MKNTKQLLIDVTFDMLYKKGYCASGLKEILEVSELTKGALYYHFKNKDELVLSAIEYYLEMMLRTHWIEPLETPKQPIKALKIQIDALYKLYKNKDAFLDVRHGCPLNNFVQDMSNKEEVFFNYLQSVYQRWQDAIEQTLKQAQENKQTKTDFDPKEQSLFILSSIEGSICSAKAHNNLSILKSSFDTLNRYISNL